ncbi:MAG: hypothetical protein K1060chlam2_00254 [Chlamydiae bacterium]|nr:hypothetical protein [Chlamydiota bacterium]
MTEIDSDITDISDFQVNPEESTATTTEVSEVHIDPFLDKKLREIQALIRYDSPITANNILEDELRDQYKTNLIFHLFNALLCYKLRIEDEGLDSCGFILAKTDGRGIGGELIQYQIPKGYIFVIQALLQIGDHQPNRALRIINNAIQLNDSPEFIALRALVHMECGLHDRAFQDATNALEKQIKEPLLGVDLERLRGEMHAIKALIYYKREIDYQEELDQAINLGCELIELSSYGSLDFDGFYSHPF